MKLGCKLSLKTPLSLWLFFIFAFFCAFSLPVSAAPAIESSQITEKDVAHFIDTINIIKSNYAKDLTDQQIINDATKGIVNNLDPHSEYLVGDDYKNLLIMTNGQFGGLGIEVITQYGALRIMRTIPGSPAEKVGLKKDDYIVALDDKLVASLTEDQAIDAMRGNPGTPIIVTVIRKDSKEPLKFTLLRAMIHTDDIESKILENGYAYIHINQFQESTTPLLVKTIETLKKQEGGKLKGVILDLRNNPGGLLDTAVSVVNTFLDSDKTTQYEKRIVYTEGRVASDKYLAYAKGKDILDSTPMVIIINEASASAAEIVAGALQDYHRALIVGEPSFGKGSVQTVIPLDDSHAIKLTTALYHTPSGRVIQNEGIIPDIRIPLLKLTDTDNDLTIDPIREFQLRDHLSNPDGTQPITDESSMQKLAHQDFQLYEALNILKTMHLMTK